MRKKAEMTTQMMEAANLWLTRKANGMTADDVAKAIGIDRKTLYRWRQTAEWREYESNQAVLIAKSHLGDVLEVLVKRALEGHAKSIEMFMKMCGLIGSDTSKTAEPPKVEERTNEQMEQELAELQRLLDEINEGEDKDRYNDWGSRQ